MTHRYTNARAHTHTHTHTVVPRNQFFGEGVLGNMFYKCTGRDSECRTKQNFGRGKPTAKPTCTGGPGEEKPETPLPPTGGAEYEGCVLLYLQCGGVLCDKA